MVQSAAIPCWHCCCLCHWYHINIYLQHFPLPLLLKEKWTTTIKQNTKEDDQIKNYFLASIGITFPYSTYSLPTPVSFRVAAASLVRAPRPFTPISLFEAPGASVAKRSTAPGVQATPVSVGRGDGCRFNVFSSYSEEVKG